MDEHYTDYSTRTQTEIISREIEIILRKWFLSNNDRHLSCNYNFENFENLNILNQLSDLMDNLDDLNNENLIINSNKYLIKSEIISVNETEIQLCLWDVPQHFKLASDKFTHKNIPLSIQYLKKSFNDNYNNSDTCQMNNKHLSINKLFGIGQHLTLEIKNDSVIRLEDHHNSDFFNNNSPSKLLTYLSPRRGKKLKNKMKQMDYSNMLQSAINLACENCGCSIPSFAIHKHPISTNAAKALNFVDYFDNNNNNNNNNSKNNKCVISGYCPMNSKKYKNFQDILFSTFEINNTPNNFNLTNLCEYFSSFNVNSNNDTFIEYLNYNYSITHLKSFKGKRFTDIFQLLSRGNNHSINSLVTENSTFKKITKYENYKFEITQKLIHLLDFGFRVNNNHIESMNLQISFNNNNNSSVKELDLFDLDTKLTCFENNDDLAFYDFLNSNLKLKFSSNNHSNFNFSNKIKNLLENYKMSSTFQKNYLVSHINQVKFDDSYLNVILDDLFEFIVIDDEINNNPINNYIEFPQNSKNKKSKYLVPPGRLLSRLVQKFAEFHLDLSGISTVWIQFVQRLRISYYNGDSLVNMEKLHVVDQHNNTNTHMKYDTTKNAFHNRSHCTVEEEERLIDLDSCLLQQKFEMMNICVESTLNQSSSDGQSTDDEKYAAINTKLRRFTTLSRKGAKYPAQNLHLIHTGDQLYCPYLQRDCPRTLDMHLERNMTFQIASSKDDDSTECSNYIELTHRLQKPKLSSDMMAFKAANPGCDFRDFISWYGNPNISTINKAEELNPEQVTEVLCATRKFWIDLWDAADPIPASDQDPIFDGGEYVEKILHYFETLHPFQLANQVLSCYISNSLFLLRATCDGLSNHIGSIKNHLARLEEDAELVLDCLGEESIAALDVIANLNDSGGSQDKHSISGETIIACEKLCQNIQKIESLVLKTYCILSKFPKATYLLNGIDEKDFSSPISSNGLQYILSHMKVDGSSCIKPREKECTLKNGWSRMHVKHDMDGDSALISLTHAKMVHDK